MWVQSVNETQPPARLTTHEDTCNPARSPRKEAISSSDAPVFGCTTKLSLNEPYRPARAGSARQPWAHTSKTAAANSRELPAAPGYIRENGFPKQPKTHHEKKSSDQRACTERRGGVSSLAAREVVEERIIYPWIRSMFLTDTRVHHQLPISELQSWSSGLVLIWFCNYIFASAFLTPLN